MPTIDTAYILETPFKLDELLSLYSTLQSELFELNCSDFNGCEQAMIKNHRIAAKILECILQVKQMESTNAN